IYIESLEAQHKPIPFQLHLEKIEYEVSQRNFSNVAQFLDGISPAEIKRYFHRVSSLRCAYFEYVGNLQRLYESITGFLVREFEEGRPAELAWITTYFEKYFKSDFNL